jgi:hypothetical protein
MPVFVHPIVLKRRLDFPDGAEHGVRRFVAEFVGDFLQMSLRWKVGGSETHMDRVMVWAVVHPD